MPQIVIFNPAGVPPNFLMDLKDVVNQKRLKNTDLYILDAHIEMDRTDKDVTNSDSERQ